MKVAFYLTTILEHSGGLEKYLIETSAKISEYPNISADVLTRDNKFTNKIIKALSVFYIRKIDIKLSYKEKTSDIRRRLGKARYLKIDSFKKLRSKFNEYDVIYSRNELLEAFIFKFIIKYNKMPPIIFGGHTALVYPSPQTFQERLHNVLYRGKLYKFLANGVSGFHALNESDKVEYKRLFPNKPVKKIYNPFDIKDFKNMAVQNFFLTKESEVKIKILWVGRLTEQKGVASFIAVVRGVNAKLKDANKSISWSVCGDGELRTLIDQLVHEQNNVHYYGYVDQKHMASIYKQHTLLLSTSRWEGYPYTLIEPQAFGLQEFAYTIPGVSDILKAYKGGHLVKNENDMINSLTQNIKAYLKAKRVPLSEPSYQFEPERIYMQLLSFMESIA